MTRKLTVLAVMVGLVVGAAFQAAAQDNPAKPDKPEIIGSAKCKMCHQSKKIGEQYQKWEASPHAKAYATLASDAAKAIAKEKGIADPQKDDQCLVCHTTHGMHKDAPMAASYEVAEGVGCEACHGPGSEYKSMKIMKDRDAAIKAGLVIPDEKTCTTCHNEKSPTFKPFDFAERVKMIAHPIPKGE